MYKLLLTAHLNDDIEQHMKGSFRDNKSYKIYKHFIKFFGYIESINN